MPRSRMMLAIAIPVVAVAAVAFGGWYFLIRGDEPPPVSLTDAISSVTAATAITAAEGASESEPNDLSGTWTVDTGNPSSFVGYRIDEELARIGSATAVGRTSDVTGTLEFDGATITAVEVAANLQGLRSDDDRRDGQLERQALETGAFPEATFVLAEPITVEGDPASGDPIEATAMGSLTIHGVTNPVELALTGQLVDGNVIVVGSTDILLADYDIEQPESMMVLSVAEEATMELQLVFKRG